MNRIMDDVDHLENHAELGALLSSIADVESDYRSLVTGSYLTFYRVQGSDVYVDRVLYGRRDYLRILLEIHRTRKQLNNKQFANVSKLSKRQEHNASWRSGIALFLRKDTLVD